jgi:hypothetical protein
MGIAALNAILRGLMCHPGFLLRVALPSQISPEREVLPISACTIVYKKIYCFQVN